MDEGKKKSRKTLIVTSLSGRGRKSGGLVRKYRRHSLGIHDKSNSKPLHRPYYTLLRYCCNKKQPVSVASSLFFFLFSALCHPSWCSNTSMGWRTCFSYIGSCNFRERLFPSPLRMRLMSIISCQLSKEGGKAGLRLCVYCTYICYTWRSGLYAQRTVDGVDRKL